MTGWGGGYVTDIGYVPGYYVQQSPARIVLAARLMGVACDMPTPDDPVHVLELGCGLGFTALILAASNPSWRVTGIDFNPAHIAIARALARQAGIGNAHFIEADFASFAGSAAADAVPEADFVTVHGVWSWVRHPVREGIVRLLRAKVRAGGAVHISYNALPGWQGAIGMQRLMRAAGLLRHEWSNRQVQAGLALVRELHAAGARHLAGNPTTEALLKLIPNLSDAYLAHEYMNAAWEPCFHGDVAAALGEAKLEWVASTSLLENLPALTLSAAQRAIHDRIGDPRLRELVKDMCISRTLRHDVFVRGATRLGGAQRLAALHEIALMLTVPESKFSYEIETEAGKAALDRECYGPISAALAEEPRTIGELVSLPALAERHDDPAEIAGVLVGSGQAMALIWTGAPPSPVARKLNEMLADGFGGLAHSNVALGLASPRLGAGLPANGLDLFVFARVAAGEDAGAAERWTALLGKGLEEEQRDKLRAYLVTRAAWAPVFRAAGLL